MPGRKDHEFDTKLGIFFLYEKGNQELPNVDFGLHNGQFFISTDITVAYQVDWFGPKRCYQRLNPS